MFSACAGAAIYRRSVFSEIGAFDPAHFAYLEDIDLGYRAMIYGYELKPGTYTLNTSQTIEEILLILSEEEDDS